MILLTPATPIVRTALDPKRRGGNGPWQDTCDALSSYMWACYVALGGGEMMMVDSDQIRPVAELRDECELLLRRVNNWSAAGSGMVNPTAARGSLIHVYRLLLHFRFVKIPVVTEEKSFIIDLDELISVSS